MAQPDGGGNPSEEDRKRARGYGQEQMQALYDKFQQAVAAYNANPNAQTANAMASALALLQDAAANGHDPGGQALASSVAGAANTQYQQAQQGPGQRASTGPAVAVDPLSPQGAVFQGGVSPAAPGGTELGAGADAGNNVGGMGIANRIAQSLIAQNPGAQAQGQAIGGAAQNPAMAPPTGIGQTPQPPQGAMGQAPNQRPPSQTGIAGPYVNNPETFTGTGGLPGWQQAAQQQTDATLPSTNGVLPDGSPAPGSTVAYGDSRTVPPPVPNSGAGVGPNVSLNPAYGAGYQPGNDSAGNPQSPAVARALASGMGGDPNAPVGQSFGGPGQPDSLGSPHTEYGPGDFTVPGGAPPEYANDANSWWAQEGLTTTDIYGGSYDPFDQKNGGFNNVLNAYETAQGLPGYWSDSVSPLMQQAIATSYLGQNPLDTRQEILNAIPQLAQQFDTPGTYYDPTADWTGFLQNPVEGPGGSGQGAFASLSPMDQIGWAAQMWQTIAGQSVDDQYMSSGMYQIQQLGEAYKHELRNGYQGTFIDFMRENGADSWL
jgi:hypothetical protein